VSVPGCWSRVRFSPVPQLAASEMPRDTIGKEGHPLTTLMAMFVFEK